MKNIFQQFNSRFLSPAARCLLMVLFAGQISSVFACRVNLTANPAFQNISTTQITGNTVYSGKLRWEYTFCNNGGEGTFIQSGGLKLFTGNLTPANIKGVSGLQVKASAPTVSGLQGGLNLASNNPISEGTLSWSINFFMPSASKNLGVTIEQDIVITASNSVVIGNFPDPNGANVLKALSAGFIENSQTRAWADATNVFISSLAPTTSTPTLPTFVTQTCALIVPSTLKVRTARLDEFVVRGWFGSIEAVGSSFDIRITCASASSSFTPKVTLAYGEGVPCQPGNGGGPDPQAKGIGFAIKTSVTGNKQSDYICGNSASGTNFVSFPATIANESYDQRKTLFVNYAIQSFPTSNGNVHSRVTLTAAFP